MISEFGENANSYCSFESKETALLHSENDSLQQRVNALTHEVRAPRPPAPIFNIKGRRAADAAQVSPRCWKPQKKKRRSGCTGAAGRMNTQGHTAPEVDTCFYCLCEDSYSPTSNPDP